MSEATAWRIVTLERITRRVAPRDGVTSLMCEGTSFTASSAILILDEDVY